MRKPRPLKRDPDSFRDDRLFIIACDDTYAPKQYFGFFENPRVKVHVVPTLDGTSTANRVLDRLMEFEYEEGDERWLLLDTDHCIKGGHVSSFMAAIKDAGKKNVNVALSRPCFEIWLLLHHTEDCNVGELTNAQDVEKALSQVLGSYNKTRLRTEHFQRALVDLACQRAERLDQQVGGGDIPASNTTRVYKLWRAISSK